MNRSPSRNYVELESISAGPPLTCEAHFACPKPYIGTSPGTSCLHVPIMADPVSDKQDQPPLVDRILQSGKLAFDPEISWESRKANLPAFSALLERFASDSDS